MFVRNAWYVAAALEEISDKAAGSHDPQRTNRTVQEQARRDLRARGSLLSSRRPASARRSDRGSIRCGYHGMEFNREGVCTFIPGQTIIPKRARVKSYPAVAKTDYVWIWMGQADKANPAAIADYPPDDHVNWPRAHDMLHLKASYVAQRLTGSVRIMLPRPSPS